MQASHISSLGDLFAYWDFNSHINIGILFSWGGIAGSGWNSSKGIVKKTYYLKERKDEKIYILDFNKVEFNRILSGDSFFDVLDEKCTEIELDIDFQRYFKSHPNETKIKKVMCQLNE